MPHGKCPHGVQQRLPLSRAETVVPYCTVQERHSGRYFGGFSRCLAPTGSSLAEKGALTSSLRCVYWTILTKGACFVKSFPANSCGICLNPAGMSVRHRFRPGCVGYRRFGYIPQSRSFPRSGPFGDFRTRSAVADLFYLR